MFSDFINSTSVSSYVNLNMANTHYFGRDQLHLNRNGIKQCMI